MFPLLPKLPGENEESRWSRSFVPVRDADELLCIKSDVVEALLCRILIARFDTTLEPNTKEAASWRSSGFDWYYDNAYSLTACREICSLMREAEGSLAGLPDDVPVYIAEAGAVVVCTSSFGDEACGCPLTVSEARNDCRLIAEYLERVIASAERQGALVTFSGP